ncbi:MAG: peptide chain release factor 3 [Ignavibacteria bacterium]|jgi:peptide chain release factor 3|nr:peptide chain release factor 3 [Ignavibacteria bacterium]MCU7504431.1 peptide chain release factor 3 [Ignavibacteria bacterium]MCU7517478.1 peptide chain release factor 3 [Ignavibacteria bacterium]
MSIQKEINKRRTLAIISHPDAGKTTLTEKFLLFGGAIQTAGAVKSNKIKKSATSDFMEIERQRGISVATSVMSFDYKDIKINLLDTPGHKDFAEDTYRTLTAVDSVILVIDSVKGVEPQTERLMEVCRMRKTPVIIFINKLDREGRDPFELLDELEDKLSIRVRPLSWPVGKGFMFKGVYNLYDKSFNLFRPNKTTLDDNLIVVPDLEDEILEEKLGSEPLKQLKEDVALIEGVYDAFDRQKYLEGELAPVFFGSAINNFGVKELLDTCIQVTPTPRGRETDRRMINPGEEQFSGFVFKIHANLDPKHRDRIAFLRICSGKFERNKFFHHVRLDKSLRFSSPATFMAQEKNLVEEAYPGDVVGLYDTGNFKIGDALTEGENLVFKGIPSFSPEIFKELINTDPMKTKQLEKGIQQLTDEGVAQLFVQHLGNRKIVGTVGELQFDVIQYRLLHEYSASCRFRTLNFFKACWITSDDEKKIEDFIRYKPENIAQDKDGNLVYFAESEWLLNKAIENNPAIQFHFNSEFKVN